MDFYYASAFVYIVCIAVSFLLYQWYKHPHKYPPGPKGLPIVGTYPFLGRFPEAVFKKWSQSYGPIMSAQVGMSSWVILNDYESIHEAFIKGKEHFSGRCPIPLLLQLGQNHGVINVDYNDHWKGQRRFGLATLRGFGVGRKGMEERVQEEAVYLNKALQEHNGEPFEILGELANAVSNNICSVVFGQRFDYKDAKFQQILYDMRRRFIDPELTKASLEMTLAPILRHFPHWAKANKIIMDCEGRTLDAIREQIRQHEVDFDPENPRDFIDAYWLEQAKTSDPHFTNTQLRQFVRDLFTAGTETTTSAIRWLIVCLLHHPQVKKKVHAEIHEVLGPNTMVSMSDKAKLPYTCAFVEEVYRHRTLVPLSLPHKTNADVILNGYKIPKNTQVIPNLWAVHHNPDNFKDPEKFLPERHLDSQGRFFKSPKVIPFGVGLRHCLGEQLARMEVFIFAVSMIQKFEFRFVPGKIPPLMDGLNGLLFTPYKFDVVALER